VPTSPWQRQYEQNQATQGLQERAEQLQSSAESAGLMGTVGMFAAFAAAPTLARKGGRKAISSLGKGAKKTGDAERAYQQLVSRADDYAEEADDFTGGSALLGKRREGADADYFQQAVQESDLGGMDKVMAAARREQAAANRGGRVSIGRFTETIGMKGPNRTRKEAQKWRDFTRSAPAKEKGSLRAFLQSENQRKLASSALSSMKLEQAAVLPASYAVDQSMGLTGRPSDTSITDVPGQAEQFVEYLPRYAGYEVAGGVAMGAAGALKGVGKAASKYMDQGGTGVAKTVSSAYTAISDTSKAMGRAGSEAENRLAQRVRGSSAGQMVKRGYQQSREFLMGRAEAAAGKAERFLSRRTSGSRRTPTETSKTLRGARQLFGTEKGRTALSEMVARAPGDSEDSTRQAAEDIKKTLFADKGADPHSRVAQFMGGEAVTLGDLKRSDVELSKRAERQMESLKKGMDEAKAAVQAEKGNMRDQGLADAIEGMKKEDLRVSGYMKKDGDVTRVPTGEDIKAGVAGFLNRATMIRNPASGNRQGVSIGEILGGKTAEGRSAAVEVIEGAMPIRKRGEDGRLQDEMAYFGNAGTGDVPTAAHEEGAASVHWA